MRCSNLSLQAPANSGLRISGLNPHDVRGRDWGLIIADMLPYVLGKDVVGTVSALGEGVTSFKIGDRVMSLADAAPGALQSGLQEYAIADLVNCAKAPDNVSDDQAVSASPSATALQQTPTSFLPPGTYDPSCKSISESGCPKSLKFQNAR